MQSLDTREQALRHIHLIAAQPGFWELRSLHRLATGRMEPAAGSFRSSPRRRASSTRASTKPLTGPCPSSSWRVRSSCPPTRARPRADARSRDISAVTTCFVDVDLGLHDHEIAMEALMQADPAPSAIYHRGRLSRLWLLEAPESDFRLWRAVQRQSCGASRHWRRSGSVHGPGSHAAPDAVS